MFYEKQVRTWRVAFFLIFFRQAIFASGFEFGLLTLSEPELIHNTVTGTVLRWKLQRSCIKNALQMKTYRTRRHNIKKILNNNDQLFLLNKKDVSLSAYLPGFFPLNLRIQMRRIIKG